MNLTTKDVLRMSDCGCANFAVTQPDRFEAIEGAYPFDTSGSFRYYDNFTSAIIAFRTLQVHRVPASLLSDENMGEYVIWLHSEPMEWEG